MSNRTVWLSLPATALLVLATLTACAPPADQHCPLSASDVADITKDKVSASYSKPKIEEREYCTYIIDASPGIPGGIDISWSKAETVSDLAQNYSDSFESNPIPGLPGDTWIAGYEQVGSVIVRSAFALDGYTVSVSTSPLPVVGLMGASGPDHQTLLTSSAKPVQDLVIKVIDRLQARGLKE